MKVAQGVCLVALLPTMAGAAGLQKFDGAWRVTVDCAEASDGARGYHWSFPVQVRGSVMRGQRGTPGAINSATISGRIGPDGAALLSVSGRTGDPDYSVGRVAAGYPFHFTATAHFDERSGSGKRNELRPCDLSFVKE